MKLILSIALSAFTAVSAENYYNSNGQYQNADNYNAQGYAAYTDDAMQYDSSNSTNATAYDEQYYSNYDSSYVENMNYGNGNFQYYDADGQYDESYSSAGYYDEYGAFHYYENQDADDQVDDAAAAEYYQGWQNNGGANGYYDNGGSWTSSSYENIPCQSYQADDADYDADADAENYNAAWSSNGNYGGDADSGEWSDYLEGCKESTTIRTNNCANSVVQVTKVDVLCDSPYRQYFASNGATHYGNQLCEYGDQAIVMVYFNVEEDLDWMENIYMTFGIYAGKKTKELLWAVRSVELCNTFVGKSCTRAGTYAFAFQVTFDYGQMSDRSLFVPMVEMGFSTRADEGYNLGGTNIYCKFNSFYQQYDPWFNGKRAHSSQVWGAGGMGKVAGKFGILLGVALLGLAFGLFTWSRKKSGIEFSGNADELIDDKDKTLA